jgi:aquaporin Z
MNEEEQAAASQQATTSAASGGMVKHVEGILAERIEKDLLEPIANFQNPRQEWRRLLAEVYGTFLLVIVAAGGGMMSHAFPNTISRSAAVVASGLMVMGIIMFMGKISGAHLNPAVSVAFSLRNDFPWQRVPGYIVVQLLGAALAARFLSTESSRSRRSMVGTTPRTAMPIGKRS